MVKTFNTTTVCIPSKHYMVDISGHVRAIQELIAAGKYLTITRARQYGKTTMLNELKKALDPAYEVVSLSLQGLGSASFRTEGIFCYDFVRLIVDKLEYGLIDVPPQIEDLFASFLERQDSDIRLVDLMWLVRRWCKASEKPVALLIDEIDKASNNQVFLDFLGQLRDSYISRETDGVPTFHTVVLAGVTDIKHLKSKIRDDDRHVENSPWNVAVDFLGDMSLPESGIKAMLDEYEADHGTGMDTSVMARLIRDYTNGYPFLVSRLCQVMDEQISKQGGLRRAWAKTGFDDAVRYVVAENSSLFQSLSKSLNNFPKLKMSIRSILMEGAKLTWNEDQPDLAAMKMAGFIRCEKGDVRIDNRLFEMRLYNLFLSDEEMRNNVFFKEGDEKKNIFIDGDRLNVRLVLERFIDTYHLVYGSLEERFKEKDGRELFLLYLKPIINGTGNYYIEAQTRDRRRCDVIIDYLGHQYIIELKIWRGERYNAAGERQILGYLDYFGLAVGYMLSFNFNKHKVCGVHQVHVGDKLLYEGVL